MESESPPSASPPTATDNTEVLPRGTFPGHGEVREAVKVAPEVNTSAAENMGEPTPMETGDGGHAQFGPQPDIISETHTAPGSGEQPPSKEGGAPNLTDDLCQSGGVRYSSGSASEFNHCGRTLYPYGYGDSKGSVHKKRTEQSLHWPFKRL